MSIELTVLVEKQPKQKTQIRENMSFAKTRGTFASRLLRLRYS